MTTANSSDRCLERTRISARLLGLAHRRAARGSERTDAPSTLHGARARESRPVGPGLLPPLRTGRSARAGGPARSRPTLPPPKRRGRGGQGQGRCGGRGCRRGCRCGLEWGWGCGCWRGGRPGRVDADEARRAVREARHRRAARRRPEPAPARGPLQCGRRRPAAISHASDKRPAPLLARPHRAAAAAAAAAGHSN